MPRKEKPEPEHRTEEAPQERRWNLELRTRLDELMEIARDLSRHAPGMTETELRAQLDRIEWLAEEIWRAAVYGPIEKRL
ncbi:MAG: hypothetical protein HY702_01400 [Gemmatimonadetes bacterium]|nr:hypothetical protein [Gemmatimonadota bacterium]